MCPGLCAGMRDAVIGRQVHVPTLVWGHVCKGARPAQDELAAIALLALIGRRTWTRTKPTTPSGIHP